MNVPAGRRVIVADIAFADVFADTPEGLVLLASFDEVDNALAAHPGAFVTLEPWDAPVIIPAGVKRPPHWDDGPRGDLPFYLLPVSERRPPPVGWQDEADEADDVAF